MSGRILDFPKEQVQAVLLTEKRMQAKMKAQRGGRSR